ncbi:hypothetical protein ACFL59_04140 [Planctomycetota bacterium]
MSDTTGERVVKNLRFKPERVYPVNMFTATKGFIPDDNSQFSLDFDVPSRFKNGTFASIKVKLCGVHSETGIASLGTDVRSPKIKSGHISLDVCTFALLDNRDAPRLVGAGMAEDADFALMVKVQSAKACASTSPKTRASGFKGVLSFMSSYGLLCDLEDFPGTSEAVKRACKKGMGSIVDAKYAAWEVVEGKPNSEGKHVRPEMQHVQFGKNPASLSSAKRAELFKGRNVAGFGFAELCKWMTSKFMLIFTAHGGRPKYGDRWKTSDKKRYSVYRPLPPASESWIFVGSTRETLTKNDIAMLPDGGAPRFVIAGCCHAAMRQDRRKISPIAQAFFDKGTVGFVGFDGPVRGDLLSQFLEVLLEKWVPKADPAELEKAFGPASQAYMKPKDGAGLAEWCVRPVLFIKQGKGYKIVGGYKGTRRPIRRKTAYKKTPTIRPS